MAGQVASATMINDIGFTQITSNGSDPPAGANQFVVDIFNDEGDAGENQVLFQFFNNGPSQATIAEIYFDDDEPPLLNYDSLDFNTDVKYSDPSGMEFVAGANPVVLPSGDTVNPDFIVTFGSQADNPAPHVGVNPGEWVSFLFDLAAGTTFAEFQTALGDSDMFPFRMGLHVINFANEESESFVSNPPPNGEDPGDEEPPGETPVPEPTSMMLLALGAVGLGGYARRRNRKQESATP